MNKLVLNHLEKIIVTSDCATILKELEVQHPAAKMLVLASEMQENEFGDQTNFVSDNVLFIAISSTCSHTETSFSLPPCRPFLLLENY